MPGLGTSERTKNNAKELMDRLGITYQELPISDEVLAHLYSLKKSIICWSLSVNNILFI